MSDDFFSPLLEPALLVCPAKRSRISSIACLIRSPNRVESYIEYNKYDAIKRVAFTVSGDDLFDDIWKNIRSSEAIM